LAKSRLGRLWLSPGVGRRPLSLAWANAPSAPAGSVSRLGFLASSRVAAGPAPLPRLGLRRPFSWLGRSLISRLGLWPTSPAGPASRRPCFPRPGGLAPVLHPAGPDQEDPAWPGFLPRASICAMFWLGQAGIPWPRPDYPLSGRDSSLFADLAPPGPRFTSSGTYSSSGIDSSALCQSWDALWLRLAHPPSLCWSWDAPWLRPAYSTSPS
jgi:hypothetical protein